MIRIDQFPGGIMDHNTTVMINMLNEGKSKSQIMDYMFHEVHGPEVGNGYLERIYKVAMERLYSQELLEEWELLALTEVREKMHSLKMESNELIPYAKTSTWKKFNETILNIIELSKELGNKVDGAVNFELHPKLSSNRTGVWWTKEEEKILLDYYDNNVNIDSIAKKLGRKRGGVENRLAKLGIAYWENK